MKKAPKTKNDVVLMILTEGMAHWLTTDARRYISLRSDFDIISAGANGITKASIDKLTAHIGITKKNMAEDILDLSVKTLERKSDNEKLDKKTSSHALEIARVFHHAYEVFEDEDKVKHWLNTENRALNNMKPVRLFDTFTGLGMVNDVLGRIEEGVYS